MIQSLADESEIGSGKNLKSGQLNAKNSWFSRPKLYITMASTMSAANSASLIPRLICCLTFGAVIVTLCGIAVVSTSELAPQVSSSSLALPRAFVKQVNPPSYFEMLGLPLIAFTLLSTAGQVLALVISNSLSTTSHSFSLLSSQSQQPSFIDSHSFTPSSILATYTASSVATSVHLSSTQNGTTPSSSLATATSSSSAQPSSSTNVSAPTQTADPSTLADINTIALRRLPFIIASASGASSISSWLSSLGTDGTWKDVDYTTGCPAQRANWPAEVHWQRVVTLSSAYHGGLKGASQWVNDPDVLAAISLAIDFWFANDFTNNACLDQGGLDGCPCGTPGLWNTNWFSNIIGIPELVGQSCLLLNSSLTATQLSNCTNISQRAFGTFGRNINGLGTLTGANTLDVASVGIDSGLLTLNASLVQNAYSRVHNEVVVQESLRADGIRPDGSFGQHAGIIYNGNYGKDYTNDVLALEIEAAGTQFEAGSTSKEAFASLIDGDQWMIYRNVRTGVLHWDFSVLGRFISFPVADKQATTSIKINITELQVLGDAWNSDILLDAFTNLSKNTSNANAGPLNGNRVFYDNDYMVHRGPGYVSTLRMYSSRTTSTECINSESPFGFHLSDGTVYTYLDGDEYEDIAAAWDWNLIPGTTVDYAATKLSCAQTQFAGIESFVGGVSTGRTGIGAMKYTNPLTDALHWQKAWFFLEGDVQHVMINSINSTSNASVFSVLDQRKHVSEILVDGVPAGSGNFSHALTLWHGNVGYTFPQVGTGPLLGHGSGVSLSINVGNRTGNWSALGISTQPPANVDLFSAWLYHFDQNTSVSYSTFPATSYTSFVSKLTRTDIMELQNDRNVSAILDRAHQTAMFTFWSETGGNVTIPNDHPGESAVILSSDKALLVILDKRSWTLTVSDPSQSVVDAQITLRLHEGRAPKGWGYGQSLTIPIVLPSGSATGSSVSIPLH